MHPARVLRSAAFRLALVFAVLFAAGAVVLVATFDAAVRSYAERSTLRTLEAETELLRAKASVPGGEGLRDFILKREQTAGEPYRYLLLDAHGRRLAGSLPMTVARTGRASVLVPERAEPSDPGDAEEPAGEMDTIETIGFRPPGGGLIVVGRDASGLNDLTEWVNRITLWSGGGVALLALLGAYLVSAMFVARVDRVDAAARRIMTGDLHERLPTIGVGDEFNRLSASLNQMLDRIEAAMAGLRQVSTDIAHDLRTPLTRLRQTLEAVRASSSLEAHAAANQDVLDQVDQVLATFNALLRIGLIEGGAGRARFAGVDLSEVMERVFHAYLPAAEDAGKRLTAELQPGVHVRGDAELLAQAFVNLVENALAHSGAGASISMGLRIQGGMAVAEVADDGPGIPLHERGKVVRRFYRLESSRTTPGAGLGLALVSAIAELHQASFVLADNDPGARASLTFDLLQG